MAVIIFCFTLGERREAAMAGTHLALAFAGEGRGDAALRIKGHTGLTVKTIAIEI